MPRTAPAWAQDILIEVAILEGRDDLPDLTWRRTQSAGGSGIYYPEERRIVVSANSKEPRWRAKTGLLHETAHWLVDGHGHSDQFWDCAWMLYRRYRLPLRKVLVWQTRYRAGADKAYRRSVANRS